MVHLISKSNASQNVRIAKNGTLVVAIIQSDFHITQMVAKNSVAVKRNLGRTVIPGPLSASVLSDILTGITRKINRRSFPVYDSSRFRSMELFRSKNRLIINQYYNVVPAIVCSLMEPAHMEVKKFKILIYI